MTAQSALSFGRIVTVSERPMTRLSVGGRRRPPDGGSGDSRSPRALQRRRLRGRQAQRPFDYANSAPDMAGTYLCVGPEDVCETSGRTFTVTQNGPDLEFRNENGEVGKAGLSGNNLAERRADLEHAWRDHSALQSSHSVVERYDLAKAIVPIPCEP